MSEKSCGIPEILCRAAWIVEQAPDLAVDAYWSTAEGAALRDWIPGAAVDVVGAVVLALAELGEEWPAGEPVEVTETCALLIQGDGGGPIHPALLAVMEWLNLVDPVVGPDVERLHAWNDDVLRLRDGATRQVARMLREAAGWVQARQVAA